MRTRRDEKSTQDGTAPHLRTSLLRIVPAAAVVAALMAPGVAGASEPAGTVQGSPVCTPLQQVLQQDVAIPPSAQNPLTPSGLTSYSLPQLNPSVGAPVAVHLSITGTLSYSFSSNYTGNGLWLATNEENSDLLFSAPGLTPFTTTLYPGDPGSAVTPVPSGFLGMTDQWITGFGTRTPQANIPSADYVVLPSGTTSYAATRGPIALSATLDVPSGSLPLWSGTGTVTGYGSISSFEQQTGSGNGSMSLTTTDNAAMCVAYDFTPATDLPSGGALGLIGVAGFAVIGFGWLTVRRLRRRSPRSSQI